MCVCIYMTGICSNNIIARHPPPTGFNSFILQIFKISTGVASLNGDLLIHILSTGFTLSGQSKTF